LLAGTATLGLSVFTITHNFTNIPARYIFPAAGTMVLILCLKKASSYNDGIWTKLGLGFLAGLAALNNPEFGIPFAIAILLAVLTSPSGARTNARVSLFVMSGIIAAFGIYFITIWVFTGSIVASNWGIFIRILGSSDSWNVLMNPSGTHVFVVATLLIGLLVGLHVRNEGYTNDGAKYFELGTYLVVGSTWGLISLPYFAGRSYAVVALAGLGYQFIMVVSGLISLIVLDHKIIRKVMIDRTGNVFSFVFIFVTIFIFPIVLFLRVPTPEQSSSQFKNFGSDFPLVDDLSARVTNIVMELDQSKTVIQMLPMSHFIELETGVRSVLVTSHQTYVNDYAPIREKQCKGLEQIVLKNEHDFPTKPILLIVEAEESPDIMEGCRSYFLAVPASTPQIDELLLVLELTKRS